MNEVKDTRQAQVRIGFDGRVHKVFHGTMARERFMNELRVLKHLEKKGCAFVPRVLHADEDKLYLVTTNAGARVDKISQKKVDSLFHKLEKYGVRHEDRFDRNVTYNRHTGEFCIIDFEFATILDTGEGLTVRDVEKKRLADQRKQIEDL